MPEVQLEAGGWHGMDRPKSVLGKPRWNLETIERGSTGRAERKNHGNHGNRCEQTGVVQHGSIVRPQKASPPRGESTQRYRGCVPKGIRTPVAAVKGRCPRPG